MEKSEKLDQCDAESMATINVGHNMDYQEPPPAYRAAKSSTTLQVAKLIVFGAVVIAAMLSISLVFSAWITAASCRQEQQLHQHQPAPPPLPVLEALLQQPEDIQANFVKPELQTSESKGKPYKFSEPEQSNSESSEEDSSENEDAAVTMLKLPLELSLHEHMFERNHRSHMNCVIEKKKAEEIVDEQSKPLPALLGINMTTDPRYLHFTGEKMAISCDSGNNQKQMPRGESHSMSSPSAPSTMFLQQPPPMGPIHHPPPPSPSLFKSQRTIPGPIGQLLQSALSAASSSSLPVHVIGPIPLAQNSQEARVFRPEPTMPYYHSRDTVEELQPEETSHLEALSALGIPPQLVPIIMSPEGSAEQVQGPTHSHPQTVFYQPQPQPSEVRERILPPNVVPRGHMQFHHVIRPRSVDQVQEKPEAKKRTKRCACDCACKNHQE